MTVLPDIGLYVDSRAGRLVKIAQDLVRIPSENRAPAGSELACQKYVAGFLQSQGWEPAMYTPDEAPGIHSHPLFWPGRIYDHRPNVAARKRGTGGGRSLILSGHLDTVPVGAAPWRFDPFGGAVEGNRLYGRGSNDMKAGVATNLFVVEALTELGIELRGDLTFETVVDEEFGGVNGTLAGRLMGFTADAAIVSEPSSLRVCNAQRGGRTVDLIFEAPNAGILDHSGAPGAVEQLRLFLNALPEFERMRRHTAPRHPLYGHLDDPAPVTVTRVWTAQWGTSEPTNTPGECRVQLFWQTMPGERVEEVDAQFFSWLEETGLHPRIEHPIRWLPGSAVSSDEALVRELSCSAAGVLGRTPPVQGIEGPCDMYVFHEFGIPAVLWGASGGNTHNPDEYVDIDSLVNAAKVLLTFVCRWCS